MMIKQNKKITEIESSILGQYILEKRGQMSHLKLQKLLYLIEGYHLAYFDKSIISDDFEAWVHGPVSRTLYSQLKDLSILYTEISYVRKEDEVLPSSILSKNLTSEQIELIDNVLDLYSNESSLSLESITHQQAPWIETREGFASSERCEKVIPKEKIKSYFQQFVG
jgi:uncharacterized phage-associated protein